MYVYGFTGVAVGGTCEGVGALLLVFSGPKDRLLDTLTALSRTYYPNASLNPRLAKQIYGLSEQVSRRWFVFGVYDVMGGVVAGI